LPPVAIVVDRHRPAGPDSTSPGRSAAVLGAAQAWVHEPIKIPTLKGLQGPLIFSVLVQKPSGRPDRHERSRSPTTASAIAVGHESPVHRPKKSDDTARFG
jgi:hypothetical protein